jgi:heme exporter protein C
MGLKVTPPDAVQDEYVRLIYIHPAMATIMYVAFGITAAASALYLYPRTRSRFWDLLGGAAAEVGVVFCGLVLITGSIWGRPTWGVWWTWDARLTSTALLFVLFLGYLALRRVPADAATAAKRSAIAALIAVADVPIVHFSVEWWRTLHQQSTLAPDSVTIHGSQLFTMLFSFPTFGLVMAWLLVHRFRMERALDAYESVALDVALEERRAEGRSSQPVGANS